MKPGCVYGNLRRSGGDDGSGSRTPDEESTDFYKHVCETIRYKQK